MKFHFGISAAISHSWSPVRECQNMELSDMYVDPHFGCSSLSREIPKDATNLCWTKRSNFRLACFSRKVTTSSINSRSIPFQSEQVACEEKWRLYATPPSFCPRENVFACRNPRLVANQNWHPKVLDFPGAPQGYPQRTYLLTPQPVTLVFPKACFRVGFFLQGYGRIPPKCTLTKFDMGNGAKGIPPCPCSLRIPACSFVQLE